MTEHENPAVAASWLPAVVLDAVADNHGLTLDEDTVRDIEDRHAGGGESIRDWAIDYLEGVGGVNGMDESLMVYFEYERWASDMEIAGDIEVYTLPNGWVEVFHTH